MKPVIFFNDIAYTNQEYSNYSSVPYINLGNMVKDSSGFLTKTCYMTSKYDKTLKNIKFYITDYMGSRPATYIGEESSPYIFDNTNNKLYIKLDKVDSIYTINFGTGTKSVEYVVSSINSVIGLNIASSSSNKLMLISSIFGHTSEIYIMSYSTALPILGLSSCNRNPISWGIYEKWGNIDGEPFDFDGNPTINMNELLIWGDLGKGLEIGYGSIFNRFTSSVGVKSNPILMNWGDGLNKDELDIFDNGHNIPVTFRLSIPDSSNYNYNNGFRGISFGCDFSSY